MGVKINPSGIITLLTDFGLDDEYVGVMKGVILDIFNDAKIVDISHNVNSFDILQGAMLIKRSYKYFPKGTVHVVVIDPGVGGVRREIIVNTGSHFFVGPDNGVLSFPVSEGVDVWKIMKERLPVKKVSRTFHGRDVFAPVGALLAKGVSPDEIGEKVEGAIILRELFPEEHQREIKGIVAYFDKFGNAVTTIPNSMLKGEVIVGGKALKLVECYEEGESMCAFAIKGSGGFLEISTRKEDVRRVLNIKVGDVVKCVKQ